MAYELKTKEVDLGDGQTAVFFVEFLHGTQKAVNSIMWPFLKVKEGETPRLVVEDGKEPTLEGAKAIGVDLTAVRTDEVNDAILLGQVKEWSFGPVSQATLDGLPERLREKLVGESNILYGKANPLAGSGVGN